MSDPVPSAHLSGDAIVGDALVSELLAARLVAVLATLEPDGAIHAVPMWFALHDDSILLATSSRSRKVRNLEFDPRATLVVHDSRAGFEVCGASLAGRVEIVRGPDAARLVRTVHGRYVVEQDAPAEARAFLGSDDVALRLRPRTCWTWDERGSAASRALRDTGLALPLVPTASRP